VHGKTHIYTYPDNESANIAEIIRLHAIEGQLHPYAALILMQMVNENA
jgi:hypothetical protein